VKSVGVGTAPLPEATRIAFEKRFGVPVLRNYGQTEFAGAIAFERFSDVAGRRPPGSVGRLAPGVEVRILDTDGNPLPEGSIGEIVARSGSSMHGYLGDAGATFGRDNEGWIATGDLGFLHDGDMLTVVGRTRDMILCGGFNVYPSQVEAALNRLPGVIDSAVAGVPDERLGEVPVALVVTDGTPLSLDGVRQSLRRQLAPYELPRRLHLVDAIPRTDNGKVDRQAVAQAFADGDEPST
jgi:fatty-acyl-CoA synthase/O-succinylbenzoic acid--CoA ligase